MPHPYWLKARRLRIIVRPAIRFFTAFCAVENNPQRQFVAEIFEAMSLAGRNKEQIGFVKCCAKFAADKLASTACDDINLIAGMW